jgi:hypothetical protein
VILAKNRHTNQWNRIKDTELSPHSYSHLIFHNVPKIYIGEKTASSTNGVRKDGYLHVEDRNYIPISHPGQKSYSKWHNFTVRPKTLQLL